MENCACRNEVSEKLKRERPACAVPGVPFFLVVLLILLPFVKHPEHVLPHLVLNYVIVQLPVR